jgi:hypothetical protein
MSGTLNRKALQAVVLNSPAVKKILKTKADQKVKAAKANLLSDFNAHPVTKEIQGGSGAANSSGTLGGYGNLFSFLGFNKSANPVGPVISALSSIRLGRLLSLRNGVAKFDVIAPSREHLEGLTKMPWESGRSWLFDIERGISGLGSYLYGLFGTSRSGGAIQSKTKYRNTQYKAVKYFSSMFNEFKSRLRR